MATLTQRIAAFRTAQSGPVGRCWYGADRGRRCTLQAEHPGRDHAPAPAWLASAGPKDMTGAVRS